MNLKIATYNIEFGRRINQVTDNIQKLASDGVNLFCLQEVRESVQKPLLKIILKKLGSGWLSDSFIGTGSRDLGLATVWYSDVIQLKKSDKLLLPKLNKYSFHELVARKLTLNFVKTTPQRAALINTFHFQGQLIRICNLHLDCAGGFTHKAKQLDHITNYLKSLPQIDRVIACGDFNTIGPAVFTGWQEQKIRTLLGDNFINVHPQALSTQKKLFQRLDYIFVNGIEIKRARVEKMKGSDHFPLSAHLVAT